MITQFELDKVNALLAKGSMWDGYWISEFAHDKLTVAASFDRMYYRNIELRFFDVTFFNLPHEWRDTETTQGSWLRLSSQAEWATHFPGQEIPPGLSVLAFDLVFEYSNQPTKPFTAFVFCSYLEAFEVVLGDGGSTYEDPWVNEEVFPCPFDRVAKLRASESQDIK